MSDRQVPLPGCPEPKPKAPTAAFVSAWNKGLREQELPELTQGEIRILVRLVKNLWFELQESAVGVNGLIHAWFESDFGFKTGYSITAFQAHRRALMQRLRRDAAPSTNARNLGILGAKESISREIVDLNEDAPW